VIKTGLWSTLIGIYLQLSFNIGMEVKNCGRH
jgi:hypothetical protein